MHTLIHIRDSAARVAGLGLLMAVFGLVAATYQGQSLRDAVCCGDDVRCGAELGPLAVVPCVGGTVHAVLREPPSAHPTPSFHAPSKPVDTPPIATSILRIAPKTSPPA